MRSAAAIRLQQLLAGLEGPFAVCGDFNQGPELWQPDGPRCVPNPVEPTYPADAPGERIDYWLLREAEATARTLSSTASDHLPLLIELSFAATSAAA